MNSVYKNEMVSAVCPQNQRTFAEVVESCCDLHRLNSYNVLDFHPTRITEKKCNCEIREFTTPIALIFFNYCAQCI